MFIVFSYYAFNAFRICCDISSYQYWCFVVFFPILSLFISLTFSWKFFKDFVSYWFFLLFSYFQLYSFLHAIFIYFPCLWNLFYSSSSFQETYILDLRSFSFSNIIISDRCSLFSWLSQLMVLTLLLFIFTPLCTCFTSLEA